MLKKAFCLLLELNSYVFSFGLVCLGFLCLVITFQRQLEKLAKTQEKGSWNNFSLGMEWGKGMAAQGHTKAISVGPPSVHCGACRWGELRLHRTIFPSCLYSFVAQFLFFWKSFFINTKYYSFFILFFFLVNFYLLFIFGCVGSLLPRVGFL